MFMEMTLAYIFKLRLHAARGCGKAMEHEERIKIEVGRRWFKGLLTTIG
jgi:hypothetical protein